jgi:hypothetical protein
MEDNEKWYLYFAVETSDGQSDFDSYRLESYATEEEAKQAEVNLKEFLKAIGGWEQLKSFVLPQDEVNILLKSVKGKTVEAVEASDNASVTPWIETTIFYCTKQNAFTTGVIAYDGHSDGFDNTWDNLPYDGLDVLRKLKEDTTTSMMHVLQTIIQNECDVRINGVLYPWQQIRDVLEE